MKFGTRCGIAVTVAGVFMLCAQMLTAQAFSSSNEGGTAAASPFAGQAISTAATPFEGAASHLPMEYGVLAQGGFGATEDRNDFKFAMAGIHAGKVLYKREKPGLLRGNFEYAMELFPFWQSYTPK